MTAVSDPTDRSDTGGAGAPFYITTAIAYPNGAPHIGHAYEYIATDMVARFKRMDGYAVRYLTGTDEHGLKVAQSAAHAGVSPAEFAGGNSDVFEQLQKALGITFDRFIRTTDSDHYAASQAIWERMAANGDIYLGTFEGWYSVRDEAYYAESETSIDANGVRIAIGTGTPVEWTEESTYFFRLSAYQDKLLELYSSQPEFVGPSTRRNEMTAFVSGGLKDLSISRTTFDWGVPVPGDEKHVMYVWVDALTNYLTGVGFPDTDGELYRTFWPADLHMIGKDITRFHTVYWPAFLMSAGLPLPKRVYAHGFLFNKGEKMSKSVGNVIDPLALVDEYGLDQLRFFLLREVSFGQDGSYSHDGIVARINADLANELGNLAQRSLTMVAKNCGAAVPQPGELTADDQELLDKAGALLGATRAHVENLELHLVLAEIWQVLGDTNRYFSAQQPWVLRKTDPARMATVLWVTLEVLRIVGLQVSPVMPDSASTLLNLLAVDESERTFAAIDRPLVADTPLPAPAPIFPRYIDPPTE